MKKTILLALMICATLTGFGQTYSYTKAISAGVTCSVACTDRSAAPVARTGVYPFPLVAGTNGSVVTSLQVTYTDPTAASSGISQVVSVWVKSNGILQRAYQLLIPATTASATALSGAGALNFSNFYLKAGDSVFVGGSQANTTTAQFSAYLTALDAQ